MEYSLLIAFLVLSIGFSFLCSILEAIILSVTPSYVALHEKKGTAFGERLAKLKKDIDRPLAAILSLNTISHTVGAAGVGAQAQIIWGQEALTLVSILLTLAILFLSEIIPKTLGANYWKTFAPFAVRALIILIFALYPLVIVCEWITKLLKKGEDSVLSREELTAMAELSEQSGGIAESESKIIGNLLGFEEIKVKDIMTPRIVVYAAEESDSIDSYYSEHDEIRFSRIPLYNEDIDNITGYFLKDHLLEALIKNRGENNLSTLKREIIGVPEMLPLPKLFERFLFEREQIALVVDEFGGMQGIVTLEDCVETLLGLEIMDELDNIDDMQEWARRQWEKRARRIGLDIEEL